MDDTTYNTQNPSDTTEEHTEAETFELNATGYLAAGEYLTTAIGLGAHHYLAKFSN